MALQEGRMQTDTAAWAGQGFADLLHFGVAGNIAAYVSGLDALFVPLSYPVERHGIPLVIADWQAQYQTQGVGGSGSDTFILREIDGTVDLLGTGTVSTSGATVTGVSTAFVTAFAVGDLIRSVGQTMKITAIASNTSLTLEAAPSSPWSGAAFWKVPYIRQVASFSIAANLKFVAPDFVAKTTDLRTNGVGISLQRGRGLRLDSAGIGSGYSPTPAGLRLRIAAEGYGIVA
jgi:hypothetical protein